MCVSVRSMCAWVYVSMCESVCAQACVRVCVCGCMGVHRNVCESCTLRSGFGSREIRRAVSGEFSLCPLKCPCVRGVAWESVPVKSCQGVCGVGDTSVMRPCPLVLN